MLNYIKKLFGLKKANLNQKEIEVWHQQKAYSKPSLNTNPIIKQKQELQSDSFDLESIVKSQFNDIKINLLDFEIIDPPEKSGIWYYLSERSGSIYEINLEKVECNCANYVNNRMGFNRSNPRKYCSHLLDLSTQLNFCRKLNTENKYVLFYFKEAVERKLSLGKNYYSIILDKVPFLIIDNYYGNWKNVCVKKGASEIDIYGYDRKERRWAYGVRPPHSVKIKKILNTFKINDVGIDIYTEIPFLEKVNMLRNDRILSDGLLKSIFRALHDSFDIKEIKKCLNKLECFVNIDKKKLSQNWRMHAVNLESINPLESLYFYSKALQLAPRIKVKDKIEELEAVVALGSVKPKKMRSLNVQKEYLQEGEERKFQEKLEKCTDTIPLDVERSAFLALEEMSTKINAINLFNEPVPDWYDANKHARLGYNYADFVRGFVAQKSLKVSSHSELRVIDYVASMAILNGKNMSRFTLAQMFYVKGKIGYLLGNKDLSAIFFSSSKIMYPKRELEECDLTSGDPRLRS